MEPHELTPFERGIDVVLHYRDKPFTLTDLVQRYGLSYKRAYMLKNQIENVVRIEFAGYYRPPDYAGGPDHNLWKMVI